MVFFLVCITQPSLFDYDTTFMLYQMIEYCFMSFIPIAFDVTY